MRLLVTAAFSVLLAACSDAGEPRAPDAGASRPQPPGDPAGALRTFSEPGDTIRVGVGEAFRLALPSDHSTGYQWMLVNLAGQGPLRVTDQRYETPADLGGRNGAGGTETWRVEATEPGSGVVSLVYVRPSEDAPLTDTTRFHVVVEGR